MLRYRKNRRLSERTGSHPYQKARGYRRLNESVVDEVKIENLLGDNRETRNTLSDFLDKFCKERNLHFTILVSADDYRNDDGTVDEEAITDEIDEQAKEVYGELASEICRAYNIPITDEDYWEPLFYGIWELDLPYIENPILAVYDQTGETWPEPPENY